MAEAVAETDLQSDPKRRWLAAGGVALALHVAVIGGAMLTFRKPTAFSLAAPDAFRVMMMPTPPAPPTDVAAGKVQDEAQPKVAEQTKPLPFTPPPETSVPVAAAIQVPKPADHPAAPTDAKAAVAVAVTTRPPASTAPQTPAAAPPSPSGAPSASWEAKVLAQLERVKRYPAKARYFQQQDTVVVHFAMDRQGRVLSSRIVQSQHFGPLDEEALALLKRAQPLPAPPADVLGQTVELTVPVQFYIH